MYDEFDSNACGYYDDSEAYLEQARKRATFRRIDREIAHERRHDTKVVLMCLMVACAAIACVVALGITAINMAQILMK
jgi:hypothetical protein